MNNSIRNNLMQDKQIVYKIEDWKQSLSYNPWSFVLIRERKDGSRKVIAYFIDNAEACNVCSAMNFYNEEIENLLKGAPE